MGEDDGGMREGESEDRTVLLTQIQDDLGGIGTVEEEMPVSDNRQVEGTWRPVSL